MKEESPCFLIWVPGGGQCYSCDKDYREEGRSRCRFVALVRLPAGDVQEAGVKPKDAKLRVLNTWMVNRGEVSPGPHWGR